ncbi:hypothetical protein [Thermoflexibacter ruber]|uniref:hypothetical protein n=1 Tax=Thermoflexibacter ruber TaxID=1003 RepID=UPI000B808745|nr:hypothetical protein [Thermoflexibacter ruber]
MGKQKIILLQVWRVGLGDGFLYVAKRWHFVCRFSICLLLIVASFRVATNETAFVQSGFAGLVES